MDTNFGREIDCLAAADRPVLPLISVRPAGLDAALAGLPPETAAFLRATGFRAEVGPTGDAAGSRRVVVAAWAGLGTDRSPFAHGGLATALPPETAWHLEAGDFDRDAAILGFCLGAYRYEALTRRHASDRDAVGRRGTRPRWPSRGRSGWRAT